MALPRRQNQLHRVGSVRHPPRALRVRAGIFASVVHTVSAGAAVSPQVYATCRKLRIGLMGTASHSMIHPDGRLDVHIPVGEVTWFSFLTASRLATSEEGGWNSKRHWVKRGLDRLAPDGMAAPFIARWTQASLEPEAAPYPRADDFQIALRLDAFRRNTRGRAGSPRKKSENDLNWNLSRWLHGRCGVQVDPNRRRVATYELPLAAESTGQLKADVVVFDRCGLVEVVELKRSASESPENPLLA
jgi:hypothetical protein